MKGKWRWVIVGVLVIGAVGGFFWFRNRGARDNEQEILRTAAVVRDDLEITVSASGNIEANQKAELRFETVGTVATVDVEVGDRVEAGDLLAHLEMEALALAVEEAEVRLEQAEEENVRQLREARLNLQAAEARLEQGELRLPGVASAAASIRSAEANLNRVQGGASEEDIAIARRQVEQAKNNLWGQQAQRDAICGVPNSGPSCDSAQATVQQLEESVRIAQLQLDKLLKGPETEDVAAAQAQLDQARAEYSRAASENAAQERNLETLQVDVERAQITIERLEEGVDPLLEIALERAQDNLDAALLTAPFSGLVAAVNLQEGVQAPTTLPALTLVDDTVFFVEVTVDETDIGKLEIGQAVEVIVDAYPEETLEGTVVTIAPAPATTSGNVGIVSYPVRIRLEPPEEVQIRDGMTASVLIRTRLLEEVLLVPNWAIRTDQDNQETYTYCYCIQEGQPVRREVTIGARNEQFTQILEGLEAGDVVALVTEERNLFEFGGGPPSGN